GPSTAQGRTAGPPSHDPAAPGPGGPPGGTPSTPPTGAAPVGVPVKPAAPGPDIAAGLAGRKRNTQLRAHPDRTGGKAYWDWEEAGLSSTPTRGVTPEQFGKSAEEAFGKAGRIHFDLDGIPDPIAFANEGAEAGWVYPGLTKAELNLIRSRPD